MNLAINVPQAYASMDAVYQITYESFYINSNPKAKPLPNKPVRYKALYYHNIQIPPQNQRQGTSVVQGIAYCVRNRTLRSPSPSCTLGLKRGRGKCKIQEIAEEFRDQIKQAERGQFSEHDYQLLRDLRRVQRLCGDVERSSEFQQYYLSDEEKFRIYRYCRNDSFGAFMRKNSHSFRNSFAESFHYQAAEQPRVALCKQVDDSLSTIPYFGAADRHINYHNRPQSAVPGGKAAEHQFAVDAVISESREQSPRKTRSDSANLFAVYYNPARLRGVCAGEVEFKVYYPKPNAQIDFLYTYGKKENDSGYILYRQPQQMNKRGDARPSTEKTEATSVIQRDYSLISYTFADLDGGLLVAQKRSRAESPQSSRRRSTLFDTFSFYK